MCKEALHSAGQNNFKLLVNVYNFTVCLKGDTLHNQTPIYRSYSYERYMNHRIKLRANFQELARNKVLLESVTLQNKMLLVCQIIAHIKMLKIIL
jgi:hypothetical protein